MHPILRSCTIITTEPTHSATATSTRSPGKAEWPGSATAAIIKGPGSRVSSRAGSKLSVMRCAATATMPGPLRSPSPPRCSTECSTLDARTPPASPDQQRGVGAPLPLPPPCNTPVGLQDIGSALRRPGPAILPVVSRIGAVSIGDCTGGRLMIMVTAGVSDLRGSHDS
jgi:hypothetical protein